MSESKELNEPNRTLVRVGLALSKLTVTPSFTCMYISVHSRAVQCESEHYASERTRIQRLSGSLTASLKEAEITMEGSQKLPEFSLLGGPLHRLGLRLRLVREKTNTIPLGVALGLLLWTVAVVLAAAANTTQGWTGQEPSSGNSADGQQRDR